MEIKYSIVIPVYNNEASLPELLVELTEINVRIREELLGGLEVVFVIDGSPDRSYEALQLRLPDFSFPAQIIRHSRNFGSFAGIRTGLTHARGEYFAVMAADLQDPPSAIFDFFKSLTSEPFDVVVGARGKREDPFFTRLFSGIFWSAYRRWVQKEIPEGGIDIFACNKIFCTQLLKLQESNSSLIGLIFWLGFRRKEVTYHRRLRPHGKSAWTFWRKLTYLSDSIYSFSDLPIRILRGVGAFGLLTSAFFGVLVLLARIQGSVSVPGYAATVLIISFFSALNLFGLGVIGSYIWRAYENTKQRPDAVLINIIRLEGK